TPGHDANDFDIGQRHGLEQVTAIGEDGRMTADAGERFAGLTVREAQAAVLAALEEQGLIRGIEDFTHAVPFSHRSGERIEPLISLQWFMRMDELAAPAIDAVRSGRVRIVPERWARVYLDWMENIRPWCLSRQLWWGHRLPVYYCDACEETYVAIEPPARCGACGGPVRQDPDVLDTWFSSALWPFATLGWPEQTRELGAFYPTDVLSTARDILFLWVARMVMMGLEFAGDVPFRDVYIHSVIQAADGRRMSKSLGTGIDPLEQIELHGADAVRFGLLAMSSSQDVRYSAEKVEQGQQLANKLWNASRLILLRIDPGAAQAPAGRLAVEDAWILSRLQRAISETRGRIESYDFSRAALGLYDFVFAELCDWYLELVKPRLYDEGSAEREALSGRLIALLRSTLALAHPLIPFVTEEIWSHVPGTDGLLAGQRFPEVAPELIDERAEAAVARAIGAVQALRRWRDDAGVKASAVIPARLEADGYEETTDHVARLARFDFTTGEDGEGGHQVATVVIPGGTVQVLATEALDLEAARSRLVQRRAKLDAEIARAQDRLANSGFVERAPADVVDAEREKLARLQDELSQLEQN
ncbi:MAG TPA: class I tRNA ligase family protein, partial [Solirubrobacteraceae bacterium]|nr:class I tRNA ligase family protein [Solirubrobacteraceae bacterium]